MIPLLNDYFFEDCDLVRAVLNDKDGAFVKVSYPSFEALGIGWADLDCDLAPLYAIADRSTWTATDFKRIYGDLATADPKGLDALDGDESTIANGLE